jgi:phosphatidylglycerol lysyltransferase
MSKQAKWFYPEHILAILIGLMGLVNLYSAILPALMDRIRILESFLPLEVRAGTRLATAFAGFALIQLAFGIWRRKRIAWMITLATLTISFITHIAKGLDFEEASLSLFLIICFIVYRSKFQANSDRPSVLRGLRTLVTAISFTFLYGTLGFYLLDRQFSAKFNLWSAGSQTIRMFTEFSSPDQLFATRYGQYFFDSIYMIGAVTMGYALLTLLAPVFIRAPSSEFDRERAAKIIRDYGHSVLARFCQFDDKHYFFSQGGSVISYAQSGRTAMVLGDPIGPPKDLASCIQAFMTFCLKNDWQFAFYQTSADTLETYKESNLRILKIGEEAYVDLTSFTLQGGEIKSVRTAVNKLEKLGFTTQVSLPPHKKELLDRLEIISNEWLLTRGKKEMRFSLGWFDRDYLNTTRLLFLYNPQGIPVAFANMVEELKNTSLAVDLMRHTDDVPAGTMDYLFAGMLKQARDWGYSRFNLGLSGLAGVGESSEDPAIERALHFIYSRVNTAYNFRGLHNFKQKFSPQWSERYLIYPGLTNLPSIAIALNDLSS